MEAKGGGRLKGDPTPFAHVMGEFAIRLALSGQKRFSQAPRSDGIGPFVPPPRPPAAAQTVPRCFGAIQRRRDAEHDQKPVWSPKEKTRIS